MDLNDFTSIGKSIFILMRADSRNIVCWLFCDIVRLHKIRIIQYYGQNFADDQFYEVLAKMREADTIVIGSPLYWHNICGAVRDLLDRFYGPVEYNSFGGTKLVFLFQGVAPEKWMLEAGEYTMSRYAGLYGMKYIGMATNQREAKVLADRI